VNTQDIYFQAAQPGRKDRREPSGPLGPADLPAEQDATIVSHHRERSQEAEAAKSTPIGPEPSAKANALPRFPKGEGGKGIVGRYENEIRTPEVKRASGVDFAWEIEGWCGREDTNLKARSSLATIL
jgi:hypothetical protein